MNMSEEEAPREPDAREQFEHWLAFLERAKRFWYVPLAGLLLGGLAFGLFMYLRTPKYRSETVILYVDRANAGSVESSGAERSITVRLKELLFARPKLERLISDFDLYPKLKRDYGMVDAVEELKKDVEFRAPGGDTFSIAFQGTSPVQARDVTAELARLVIDGDSALRKHQTKVARDFLASEKKSAEEQLRDAEQKLAAFMAEHPRFALDATPLANGVAIRATLAPAPGTASPPRPAAGSWLPRPRSAVGPAKPATPGAVAAPIAAGPAPDAAEQARARAALAAAREHLAEQLTHYTPAHPDVRAAEAAVQRASERLAALDAASTGVTAAPVAAAAAPGASGNAPAPAAVAAAPVAPTPVRSPAPAVARGPAPTPAASGGGGRSQNVVDLETEWLQLTRAVTEARQRQDQIEAQLFKADMQAGSEAIGHGVQVNVIDPAFLPERPQPPGKTTLALMFGGGALVLGLLLALLLAMIDERLFQARDLSGMTEIVVEVPRFSQRRQHVASG